jgi:hypothetical protein
MDQPRLIYDDLNDALADLVRALGGRKTVGAKLRPELPVEQAANWVGDCLNSSRRETFHPEQLMLLLRLGREAGFHAAKQYLDDETGYTRSLPRDPQDEVGELQKAFMESVVQQRLIADRIERLTRAPLSMVRQG